jgi:hypothetical protein
MPNDTTRPSSQDTRAGAVPPPAGKAKPKGAKGNGQAPELVADNSRVW